ncbi:MAG: NADH:ubiquinone oxidoreductase [Oligoflexia bacterium]|nr:NADH:ubiquinone oxidoreductase [Oligoflexia bacterium]
MTQNKQVRKNKKKLRVAFFDFACCEGCQIEFLNLGAEILSEFLNHFEVVEGREFTSDTAMAIDIALIEGSYTRKSDRQRLEDIRSRAHTVVAYGACATIGGINCLKNHQLDYKEYVYKDDALFPCLESGPALPISAIIKVDHYSHGCPLEKSELLQILYHLFHEKVPILHDYPVCMECKRRGTICRYEFKQHCLGVVARAGCGAPCPADGIPCEACRGFVDHPNLEALEKLLIERGQFSNERAYQMTRMYNAAFRSDSVPWKEVI